MLTLTPASSFVRRQGLGDANDVANLQNTLIRIGTAAGNDRYNPRMSGGTMNMGTVVATFNCVVDLGAEVPIIGDVVGKISGLADFLSSNPLTGHLVSRLLDPGQVDLQLDGLPAAAGIAGADARKAVQGYVDAIKQSQGFVAANAAEIDAGLNLISLLVPLPGAGAAAAVPTDRGAGAAAGTFTVYDPDMDLWRVFKPWVTAVSATFKSQMQMVAPRTAAETVSQPTASTAALKMTVNRVLPGTFAGPCCFGQGGKEGKIEVQELTPAAEQPAVPVLSIEEAEAKYNIKITRKSWYKAWQTWAVVGGLLALGGGATYVVRRRKRAG